MASFSPSLSLFLSLSPSLPPSLYLPLYLYLSLTLSLGVRYLKTQNEITGVKNGAALALGANLKDPDYLPFQVGPELPPSLDSSTWLELPSRTINLQT